MAFIWNKFPWTNLHDLNLDWIIQTVKTLENNLADAVGKFREIVNKSILDTLTGAGEFNVIKTGNVLINGKNVELSAGAVAEGGNSIKLSENGDVDIIGKNVRITSGSNAQMIGGAFISDSGQQLVMHNPNSGTNMTANYNSGVLSLSNNQNSAAGVAVYPINTPDDGGGDNSDFAANVGYVKGAVAAVDSKIDAEIENRTSGDAALRANIDNVIMPLIAALQQKAIFNITVSITNFAGGNVTLDTSLITQIKTAVSQDRFITITLKDNGSLDDTLYLIINNHIKQLSNPNEFKIYFKDIKGEHIADIDTATGVLTYSEF